MLLSSHQQLCAVALPYMGRRHYMHSFDLSKPVMRKGFEDYASIVAALCAAAGAKEGTAHMTVDEIVVKAGRSQRRPGPHVDGCFIPGKKHRYIKDAIGDWGGGGGWLHYCNDVGRGPVQRMAVIVVASEPGCRVWNGKFTGEPTKDGDLQHISQQLDEGTILPRNVGFLLSPDCVHESIVLKENTQRTFLRIALPNRGAIQ